MSVPIRGTTQLVGVFGYPVRHSASPPMHNAAFAALGLDWAYVPFTVAPGGIADALAGVRALGLRGVNVTVPLKELIPPLMDDLTPRAQALGAVNTVVFAEDGRLRGDSTDGPGFLAAVAYGGLALRPGMRAVVLGAGGSARAVAYALAETGVRVTVANRSVERARTLCADFAGIGDLRSIALDERALTEALADADLLVNTTSVGMHPNHDEMPPVPAAALRPDLFVSDLIYNPRETRLLALARACGCRTQNGIEMLVRQGALAFTQWTGVADPPLAVMRDAVEAALRPAS
jgi:shikimate dehydrogenase